MCHWMQGAADGLGGADTESDMLPDNVARARLEPDCEGGTGGEEGAERRKRAQMVWCFKAMRTKHGGNRRHAAGKIVH